MRETVTVALRGTDPVLRPDDGRRRRSWTWADADATRRRVLALTDLGLTRVEVARRIGVHPSTVSRALTWYRERHGVLL